MNRSELGVALRVLREASGKEAKAVARGAVMSASKLSKVETGKLAPTADDADRILTAIGVSDDVKAEYMRTVLSRHADLTEDTVRQTVSARLERQEALYDQGKTLRFVITEPVPRWLIVPPMVMVGQLDRLISVSRLPNVDLRVVPLAGPKHDIPNHSFVVRDDRAVTVETVHAEVVVTDPRDVALYVAKFDGFASGAVVGDDLRDLLAAIRDDLFRQRESGYAELKNGQTMWACPRRLQSPRSPSRQSSMPGCSTAAPSRAARCAPRITSNSRSARGEATSPRPPGMQRRSEITRAESTNQGARMAARRTHRRREPLPPTPSYRPQRGNDLRDLDTHHPGLRARPPGRNRGDFHKTLRQRDHRPRRQA
ncbi:hypothetical protein GCM10010252_14770 [Streptomyces aureoverticillatus]|nr:hypothetical protein GCM10010252_14770 [Streptomyces aureoverticillatus]